MSDYDKIVTLLSNLKQNEKDSLVDELLERGGPCTLNGHAYNKIGTTPRVEGFFGGTPAIAHMMCRRCGHRVSNSL